MKKVNPSCVRHGWVPSPYFKGLRHNGVRLLFKTTPSLRELLLVVHPSNSSCHHRDGDCSPGRSVCVWQVAGGPVSAQTRVSTRGRMHALSAKHTEPWSIDFGVNMCSAGPGMHFTASARRKRTLWKRTLSSRKQSHHTLNNQGHLSCAAPSSNVSTITEALQSWERCGEENYLQTFVFPGFNIYLRIQPI